MTEWTAVHPHVIVPNESYTSPVQRLGKSIGQAAAPFFCQTHVLTAGGIQTEPCAHPPDGIVHSSAVVGGIEHMPVPTHAGNVVTAIAFVTETLAMPGTGFPRGAQLLSPTEIVLTDATEQPCWLKRFRSYLHVLSGGEHVHDCWQVELLGMYTLASRGSFPMTVMHGEDVNSSGPFHPLRSLSATHVPAQPVPLDVVVTAVVLAAVEELDEPEPPVPWIMHPPACVQTVFSATHTCCSHVEPAGHETPRHEASSCTGSSNDACGVNVRLLRATRHGKMGPVASPEMLSW